MQQTPSLILGLSLLLGMLELSILYRNFDSVSAERTVAFFVDLSLSAPPKAFHGVVRRGLVGTKKTQNQMSLGSQLDGWIEQLYQGERLREENVKELCDKIKEKLIDEPNVVTLKGPITIVGDIQG
jgi:hypothetical protein